MGSNNSLSWKTTPPCLPPFPLSPHSPTSLTFNQLLNRNGVSSATVTATSSLPNLASRRQALTTITKRRVVWAPAYVSIEQHSYGVNYNRGSASGRGPTWGGQRHWRLKKKTTEMETRSPLATAYACTVSGRSNPGKIWMPTNQIPAISAHAHVTRELRTRAPQAPRGI